MYQTAGNSLFGYKTTLEIAGVFDPSITSLNSSQRVI